MKRLLTSAVIVLFALCSVPAQQTGRSLTINDLLKVRRISDPQVSPDGRMVAFTITDPDKTANKSKTQIYLMCDSFSD